MTTIERGGEKQKMEYKGKRVLKCRIARFFPSDDQYEDFICDLILTEDILYVVESVYDGTKITHFTISVKSIACIERYTEANPNDVSRNSQTRDGMIRYTVSAVVMLFAGVVLLPGHQKKRIREYLRIAYRDDFDKDQYLYFNQFDRNMDGIIKAVRKIQKQRDVHDLK